jgi:hypothetical protein
MTPPTFRDALVSRLPASVVLASAVAIVAACVPRPSPRVAALPSLPVLAAESSTVDTVAPGLVHRSYWIARGPWAIQVLDVDRAVCWSLVALKAGGRAVGRERTSVLVRALADSPAEVGGGVNADFFTFTPPGVPIGPHVAAGRVIAGPGTRPALALDGAGAPFIGTFAARGFASISGDSLPVAAWNQRRLPGLALFDGAWGPLTDSATGAVEVVVARTGRSRDSIVGAGPAAAGENAPAEGTVLAVDTLTAGVPVPADGVVLVLGRDGAADLRRRLAAVRSGAPVRWAVRLEPFVPREAVGGFPVLLRDSVPAADLDSAGGAAFGPVRHPRTAVGLAAGGRRLLLIVVDGRQRPYSDGMTLRELAGVLLQLGAATALNLDGGGSTTMVVRAPDGTMRIANRPSDAAGERPVANALAVVRGCR